jgi:hypothetical protein
LDRRARRVSRQHFNKRIVERIETWKKKPM